MTTSVLLSNLLLALVGLSSFGLSLYVLIKLGQEKGMGHAILGFFLFPYAYVWGWINATRLRMVDIMATLTFMIVVSIGLPVWMFANAANAAFQQVEQAGSTGTWSTSTDEDGGVSISFSNIEPIAMGTASVGGQVSGALSDGFETHEWTFQGSAGQQVTIRCEATSTTLRPDIKLLDAQGNWLTSGESGGDESVAIISGFELPAGSTYTLQIGDVGFDGGRYSLTVE